MRGRGPHSGHRRPRGWSGGALRVYAARTPGHVDDHRQLPDEPVWNPGAHAWPGAAALGDRRGRSRPGGPRLRGRQRRAGHRPRRRHEHEPAQGHGDGGSLRVPGKRRSRARRLPCVLRWARGARAPARLLRLPADLHGRRAPRPIARHHHRAAPGGAHGRRGHARRHLQRPELLLRPGGRRGRVHGVPGPHGRLRDGEEVQGARSLLPRGLRQPAGQDRRRHQRAWGRRGRPGGDRKPPRGREQHGPRRVPGPPGRGSQRGRGGWDVGLRALPADHPGGRGRHPRRLHLQARTRQPRRVLRYPR